MARKKDLKEEYEQIKGTCYWQGISLEEYSKQELIVLLNRATLGRLRPWKKKPDPTCFLNKEEIPGNG